MRVEGLMEEEVRFPRTVITGAVSHPTWELGAELGYLNHQAIPPIQTLLMISAYPGHSFDLRGKFLT